MIIKDLNLNKLLFTQDELKVVETLIQKGQHRNIMSVLLNVDPEKEAELQRVINLIEPLSDGFESEVRKQMDKELPNGPQSPEEEAEWDAKLQAEYKLWIEAQEKNRAEIESKLNKKKDKETITDENKVASDLSQELLDKQKEVSDKLKAAIKEFRKIKDDKDKKKEVKTLKTEIKALEKELDSIK